MYVIRTNVRLFGECSAVFKLTICTIKEYNLSGIIPLGTNI